VSAGTHESRCERARAWAALAPDGELAVLERRLLDAHLARCARCRAFGQQVAAIAAELRAAAAEQRSRRFALPATSLRRPSHRLRNVASAAAVAAMAFGIALQQPAVVDTPRPLPAPKATPADVEDAELRALRLFRREALLRRAAAFGTPSGAFGNRPA
jgi:predicted anti-sigma-YlaC factor YlaD